MSVADYYLIAQAKQRKAIVVTHEVPSNSLKKIMGLSFSVKLRLYLTGKTLIHYG
jgi:hypothetical protein